MYFAAFTDHAHLQAHVFNVQNFHAIISIDEPIIYICCWYLYADDDNATCLLLRTWHSDRDMLLVCNHDLQQWWCNTFVAKNMTFRPRQATMTYSMPVLGQVAVRRSCYLLLRLLAGGQSPGNCQGFFQKLTILSTANIQYMIWF